MQLSTWNLHKLIYTHLHSPQLFQAVKEMYHFGMTIEFSENLLGL